MHTHTLGIDKLIEPLRSTVQSKAKANSVKQEYEKQDELKRSAMRAIAALLTIPHSGKALDLARVDFISITLCLEFITQGWSHTLFGFNCSAFWACRLEKDEEKL